jgi:hypothetical protein
MASAKIAKPGVGKQRLIPHYLGVTDGKNAKGKQVSITHYVVIDKSVGTQLGIKDSVKKPGGSDAYEHNVVHKKNKRNPRGSALIEAKRYLKRCKRSIKLFCKGTVTVNGKQVQETYIVGFPTGVPLRLIRKFLVEKCPNVVRYGTGTQLYQVR